MSALTAEDLMVPTLEHESTFTWRCPDPQHEFPTAGLFTDRHLAVKLAQAHLDEKHAHHL